MKWTNAVVVAAGVVAGLAPGCSGNVKNPSDGSDGGADSGVTSSAGSVALGGGSHTTPAGGATHSSGGYAGRAGQGGDAGTPPDDAGSGGWAGASVEPPLDAGAGGVANDACADESGNGCIIEYGDDIRALAVDGTSVYWVTHGTFDALGNYKNDGRLFKRDLSATTATQLATGLAGPVGIGLTTTHVYVYLDQAWDADGPYALARIPIAGGSAAVIQRGAQPVNARGYACPHCFVHSGSAAYFPLSDGIYEMDSADTAPTRVTDMLAYSLTTAGQFLYFEGGAAGTRSDLAHAVDRDGQPARTYCHRAKLRHAGGRRPPIRSAVHRI